MEPPPLTEFVKRACVQLPRCALVRETRADFRTVALRLREEALTRSETMQGVLQGTIASALIGVRRFMGSDPGKQ